MAAMCFHNLVQFFILLPHSSFLSFPPSPRSPSGPQSKQSSSYSDRDTTEDDSESLEDMDFLSRQKKLQAEAKLALAMAKPMAKMQVEVEKQNRKKSPVADLVSGARRAVLLLLLLQAVCPQVDGLGTGWLKISS